MSVTALTAEVIRTIRDYIPALSDRLPGIDLATILQNIITLANANEAALGGIVTGTVTVANGATTGVVAVGAAYDGKTVVVSPAEDPGAAVWWHGVVASGNLTVTVDTDPLADADFSYIIDGR